MAKLTRVHQKQFGVNAGNSDVGVFGSLAAASPQYSKDPETIQSLAAFLTGWAGETIANNRPALEDFNALDFLSFYQLCYLFQSGVPEWSASTTYYTGSIVQNGSGVLYKSLVDDNLNNAVTDGTKWSKMLGTAASLDVGTTANKVVQLDGDGKLPAVDGSALTNLPAQGVGQIKGWVKFSANGTIAGGANVSSVVLNSTGNWTVNWTSSLGVDTYSVFVQYCSNVTGTDRRRDMNIQTQSAGSVVISCRDDNNNEVSADQVYVLSVM